MALKINHSHNKNKLKISYFSFGSKKNIIIFKLIKENFNNNGLKLYVI